MKIKIKRKDLYNADYTIALAIVKILKKYKKHRAGYTIIEAGDYPDSISDHEARYVWVLDECIYAFSNIANTRNDRINNGMRLFTKYLQSFWI
jgi:hypothetical protein